jgi:hypothetical protein
LVSAVPPAPWQLLHKPASAAVWIFPASANPPGPVFEVLWHPELLQSLPNKKAGVCEAGGVAMAGEEAVNVAAFDAAWQVPQGVNVTDAWFIENMANPPGTVVLV